jgi:hypothetical protein
MGGLSHVREAALAAAAPRTQEECDQLLTATHNRYLAAVECERISDAAELWIQLHELLDLRCHLPLQRPGHGS